MHRQLLRQTLSQQRHFTSYAYKLAKRVMPKISATEAAALNSGTIGFDRDLFSGNPNLADLTKNYTAVLSAEERAFMDNQTQQLCEMLDDHQINTDKDLPEHIWQFIKEHKFMGMIIPKEYGGLGFSGHGHSQVVMKLASRSGATAVSVMVPNSLGPGELLNQYGTEEQKSFYLPKLAHGEFIPCFALTGPPSGSDAAAMRDSGVVMEKNGVLGIEATFKKRYITLAPVASVVGLAINVSDPNNLLAGNGSDGITVALLRRGHEGLRIGDRHDILGQSFMNGTVEGENVFIPMDAVLGGQKRVGYGWNMLMECLAEGRGISLPALSVAASKVAVNGLGAYSRIRKQFKVPLAQLEGVQEHLARIGGNAYTMTAAQHLMNSMINNHEQPAVLSAVMKQQMTDRMRMVINDAMDVAGGAGICRGRDNFMAQAYQATPIAITVEGANTLTRSLIIFGQGLTRSHPHLYSLIQSIQNGDDLKGFEKHLFGTISHAIKNTGRSFGRALFRSHFKTSSNVASHYESQLNRLSSAFAFSSDVALTLGGSIKFKEMLSGRYADVLSNLYLGYATLWFHAGNKAKGGDDILDYQMSKICYDIQESFYGIYENFPIRPLAYTMQMVSFPTGKSYKLPSDSLTTKVSNLVSTDSEIRTLLSKDIFVPTSLDERLGLLNATLPKAVEADKILSSIRKEKRQATTEEQAMIDEVEAAREIIIQVNSFKKLGKEVHMGDDHVRPALRNMTSEYSERVA